jgi:hypothetical protein
MNGYNSNFFNPSLLNSIRQATQRVALGETVYNMNDIDTLDDERKRKLQQTQQAGQQAARDPETGLLKVSGAIQGVPRTTPGGDLYGVNPEGKAFVVTASPRRPVPGAPVSSTGTPTSVTAPKPTETPVFGNTAKTLNLNAQSPVPNFVDKLHDISVSGIRERGTAGIMNPIRAAADQRIIDAKRAAVAGGVDPNSPEMGRIVNSPSVLGSNMIRTPETDEMKKVIAPGRAPLSLGLDTAEIQSSTPSQSTMQQLSRIHPNQRENTPIAQNIANDFARASDTPAARRIKAAQQAKARIQSSMGQLGHY